MTVAILVQSDVGDTSAQTLLFPHNGQVNIYHRVSDGSVGRGHTWSALPDLDTLPETIPTKNPTAVILTERDTELVNSGLVTNIGAKALYAYESADPISAPISHRDMVVNVKERLEVGDQTLSSYITDKRRSSGVVISPAVSHKISQNEPKSVITFVQEKQSEPKGEPMNVIESSRIAYENMISVPDPKWAKEYINRRFDNGLTEFEIYDYALENNLNIKIEGGAGSGKTMSAIAYASARNMRYFNISSNAGMEPRQLFGGWIPNANGGFQWQDGAVTLLVRYGGVLLLNEVNFMPERIMTVLYSLLDDRREIQLLDNGGEVIKAHKDLLILADMNDGYRGTHELSQANNDRWAIKLEFPYDSKIEGKLIKSKSVLDLAKKLRDQFDREEITTPISTRGLVALQKNLVSLGLDFAISSYVNGFNKDERSAVRMAIEALKFNIAKDYDLEVDISIVDTTTTEQYLTPVNGNDLPSTTLSHIDDKGNKIYKGTDGCFYTVIAHEYYKVNTLATATTN